MSAPSLARPTAVEWAKQNGSPFTWSALLDNRDSPPITGIGWSYTGWNAGGTHAVPGNGIVIEHAQRFPNAKESIYIIQGENSGMARVYYVAGWIAAEDTMILHRALHPMGPKRAYHLTTRNERAQGAR